jgi:hypothetical protein
MYNSVVHSIFGWSDFPPNTFTGRTQNAWTGFRNEFPTPNQGKKLISIYVRKQFLTYNPQFPWQQAFRFLSVEILKTSRYSAIIENEDTLQQCVFDTSKAIVNRPETFERLRQSMIRAVH